MVTRYQSRERPESQSTRISFGEGLANRNLKRNRLLFPSLALLSSGLVPEIWAESSRASPHMLCPSCNSQLWTLQPSPSTHHLEHPASPTIANLSTSRLTFFPHILAHLTPHYSTPRQSHHEAIGCGVRCPSSNDGLAILGSNQSTHPNHEICTKFNVRLLSH